MSEQGSESPPGPAAGDDDAEWAVPRGSAFVGVRWNAAGRAIGQAIRLCVTIVVAQLVSPSDLGLMAIWISLATMLEVVKDLGTGQALIQLPELRRRTYHSVFVLNLVLGTGLGLGLALAAQPIAWIYGQSDPLPQVFLLLAPTFLITASVQAQVGLLLRRLAFRLLTIAAVTSAVVTGLVSIGFAWYGYGVWALAFGRLAGDVSQTALIWLLNPWRPRLQLHLADLRQIRAFSVNLTGANLLGSLLSGADALIVSRVLGASALGYYSIAQRLMMPALTARQVLGNVLMPALARVQTDDAWIRQDFLRSAHGLAFVVFPMLTGLALVAEPLVATLLGAKWAPAVPVVQVMAFATLLRIGLAHAATLYFTKGRTDLLLRWTATVGTLQVIAWLVGVQYGIVGIAAASLATFALLFVPGVAVPLGKIELGLGEYLRALLPYVALTVTMAVAVGAVMAIAQPLGAVSVLALAVAVGALAYGVATAGLRPPALVEVLRLVGLRGAPKR